MLTCFPLAAPHAQPNQQPEMRLATQQLAQNETPQPGRQQPQPQPRATQMMVPSDDVLLILIRATLIALNQANVTGNYSVLRDLGAPGFKEANSADKLAQTFAKMRQRGLDLSLIMLVQPKICRKAQITPKGLLGINGFFATDADPINSDLLFKAVDGRWRLFGIAANAARPQQGLEVQAAPEPAPAKAPDKSAASEPAASIKTQATPKATDTGTTVSKNPSGTGVDIRDRL